MDRGPARAFPRRGAGARPVLGSRGRVRRRRPAARRARPHDPRRGRLHAAGHQPAVQRVDGAARALHPAGLSSSTCRWSRPTRSPPCRCAAPAIPRARSPWSACSTPSRDELALDRAEVRRRNLVPAGQDALRHAAEDALRLGDHARQRRLPGAASSSRSMPSTMPALPSASAARAPTAAISASASATA